MVDVNNNKQRSRKEDTEGSSEEATDKYKRSKEVLKGGKLRNFFRSERKSEKATFVSKPAFSGIHGCF